MSAAKLRVMLIDGDPYFNLAASDVLIVEQSDWDPEKYSVIERESDEYQPECSVYKEQVRVLGEVDTSIAKVIEQNTLKATPRAAGAEL